MDKAASILCPAHRCKPGAQLLGIRQDDGTVAILPQALPIDEDFVRSAKEHPMPPEQRFRFTNKCAEGGCGQWTGTQCGIAQKMVALIDEVAAADTLFPCSIRPRCRWFLQQGADACRICPYVLTEITQEEAQAAGHPAFAPPPPG